MRAAHRGDPPLSHMPALPLWVPTVVIGSSCLYAVVRGGLEERVAGSYFAIAALAAQLAVLAIGWSRRWSLPRMLVHVLVIALIFSPVTKPWQILPVVALIPLAWSRSGWVLSLMVLGAYMAVPIVRASGRFRLPDWFLLIEWVPVMALEVQELFAAARPTRHAAAAAPAPAPTTLDPAP